MWQPVTTFRLSVPSMFGNLGVRVPRPRVWQFFRARPIRGLFKPLERFFPPQAGYQASPWRAGWLAARWFLFHYLPARRRRAGR